MKLVHSADLHLGRAFSSLTSQMAEIRREELWLALENQVAYCLDQGISYLLLTGDIFEQDYTGYFDLKRFASIVSPIDNVIVIKGNHDYRLGAIEGENIHLIDDIEVLEFPKDHLTVYGLSWTGPLEPDLSRLRDLDVPGDGYKVCLLHGDFQASDFQKAEDFFKKMDYVALGHIHKAGQLTDRAYYPGSPEPLDISEEGDHGFLKVDLRPLRVEKISKAKRKCHRLVLKDEDSYPSHWSEKYGLNQEDFYELTLVGAKKLDLNEKLIQSFFHKNSYQVKIINQREKQEEALDFMEREDILGDLYRSLSKEEGPLGHRARELFIDLTKEVL